MIHNRVKSLGTIVGVRKRVQTRLEDDLAAQRRELLTLQEAVERAREHQQACMHLQAQAQQKRDHLLGCGFEPQALIAVDHRLQSLAAGTAKAGQQLDAAMGAVDRQHEKIAGLQREAWRNSQRIDTFNNQIAAIGCELAVAEEERGDEEAEETSSARLFARRRSGSGVHDGV